MSETAGLVVGGTGLVLFAAAVVAVKAGVLDDVVVAVVGADTLRVIAVWVAVVVVVVLLLAASSGGGRRSHAHGSAACGYTARGEREMHRHERGHVNACRRAGGGGASYRVWRNPDGSWSGLTRFHNPRRVDRLPPEKQIAIDAAGMAAATRTSSPTDEPNIRRTLSGVPAAERSVVERRGRQLGRRWCR